MKLMILKKVIVINTIFLLSTISLYPAEKSDPLKIFNENLVKKKEYEITYSFNKFLRLN